MSTGQIRNIAQSVQDRDIVKQAPDIVVYLNGQNYLNNPYIGNGSVYVPFNDYVTAFQASYDVESLTPTASVTLVVPNEGDHQFRMPGGNNLLKTMDEVRVFGKGFFLSPRGNTVYRQIFRGFVTAINYNVDGKHTIITLSCTGALGLLERMQVDMAPAAMSGASQEVTPLTSTTSNLSPVDQLTWTFLYRSMLDGFDEMSSVEQAAFDPSQPLYQAVNNNFVAKWQALLYDLARDVHIFGKPNVTNVIAAINEASKSPDTASAPFSKNNMAVAKDRVGTQSESATNDANLGYYEQLRDYMPDMSFGSIQLLNSKIVSRLERLRYVASLIGFEAYQDIDGGIVFKPPLYNLDVTNVNNPDVTTLDNSLIDIYEQNNPFVVSLSEILSESENEDEGAIRATRVLVRGSLNPSWQVQGTEQLLTIADEMDIPKMAQFGLRMEPPHNAPWFSDGDSKALHAYAALELARANRAFRTYNITIAMRPELKLGFPMFIPHKDIYGYVKGVTINYTQGSAATMGVLLDTLRRRPMYPVQQSVPNPSGGPALKTTFMTPQPNLVLQWTKAPTGTSTASTNAPGTATAANTPAQLVGQIATLPVPDQQVFSQDIQMQHYREKKIANSYGPNNDSTTHSWRVQMDTNHVFDSQRKVEAAPTDTTKTAANDYYEALRSYRPYTDEKGYELVGPFPLGRWDSLKNAIYNFTIRNILQSGTSTSATTLAPVSSITLSVANAKAFLFTGDGTPSSTPEAATALIDSLAAQAVNVSNFKVFELTYDSTNTASNVGGLAATTDPGSVVDAALVDTEQNTVARVEAFLTGSVPQQTSAVTVLNSVTASSSDSDTDTGEFSGIPVSLTTDA